MNDLAEALPPDAAKIVRNVCARYGVSVADAMTPQTRDFKVMEARRESAVALLNAKFPSGIPRFTAAEVRAMFGVTRQGMQTLTKRSPNYRPRPLGRPRAGGLTWN